MKKSILYTTLIISFFTCSCKKDNEDEELTIIPVTSSQILADFTTNIALAYYNDLDVKAAALKNSINTFMATPNLQTLAAAKAAWVSTRIVWEQCEGFLFGPVAQFGFDPNIDSWPVNQVDMDSLLASSTVFTQTYLDGAPTTLKGFHPMEYILYGINSNKQPADFTPREFDYLVALAENLNGVTTQMYNEWTPSGGNFQSELLNAGQSGSQYSSKQDALLEIANAMIGIIDEVSAGKIEDPFVAQDSTLEESHFSKNTWKDFKYDMIGAKNVYAGSYINSGKSIADLVKTHNKTLDLTITQQFDAVINNIASYNITFGEAIFTQPGAITNTQTVLNNLKATLENELIPLIQTKVTD